ncbi:MAG: hypothetical protein ACXVD4_12225 [Nocardioides sp.]
MALTCLSAVLLLGRSGSVEAPVTGENVGLPYVWPAASVAPILLVARSRMQAWEARSARRVGGYHAAVLVAMAGIGACWAVVLQPRACQPLIATSLVLQACAVAALSVLGDWSWLLAAALASLTVLRSSWVESLMVTSTGVDRAGTCLVVGLVGFALAVLLAARQAAQPPRPR